MTKRVIKEALVRRGEEEKKFDRAFWREAGHEARFEAMWQMVVDLDLIRGKEPGEHRLDRTVENLRRRRR